MNDDVTSNVLPDGYLEILGSTALQSNAGVNEPHDEGEQRQLILDKQITLNKAMKAAKDGDAEEASFLFRLHSRMSIANSKSVNSTSGYPKHPPLKVAKVEVVKTSVVKNERPFVENGVTFMPG